MSATLKLENNANWIDQEKDLLPIMTAIFVEGLGNAPCSGFSSPLRRNGESAREMQSRIFRLPLAGPGAMDQEKLNVARKVTAHRETETFCGRFCSTKTDQATVRTLIRGISHHFNNLMMGIWGNASLIRLQLRKEDQRYPRVEQMERIIQSGAFLIHMVLGYLSERRTVAKRVRLNQLITEMKSESNAFGGEEDPWNFEARLKWASRVQRPRLIAGSTARVLEVLFESIRNHCGAISVSGEEDNRLQKRLSTIIALVDRGLDIVRQMRHYAGDPGKGTKKKIKPGVMIDRLLRRMRMRYPAIAFHHHAGTGLPSIKANQEQLEWAVEEMVANASRAMPDGGRLTISVQTLQQESPRERCGVHKGGNYLVLAIQDTGCGIARDERTCVFQPFFSGPKMQNGIGLGLAAADGILKSHSGYIHLQSKKGTGSIFKLYIPFEAKYLIGQKMKTEKCKISVVNGN